MHKKARRGKEQAYLSGASCWRSSTLLLLRPGAAADLQIASCCCLLQIHTAWLEEKLDPLLCTRRREEEEAAAGGGGGGRRSSTLCSALGGGRRRRRRREELCPQRAMLWWLGKRPWWSGGRQQERRGQITLEVVGPARQNNSDLAHHQNGPQNGLNGMENRFGTVLFTTFSPFKPCVDRLDGSNVYITAQGINEAVSLRLLFKPV